MEPYLPANSAGRLRTVLRLINFTYAMKTVGGNGKPLVQIVGLVKNERSGLNALALQSRPNPYAFRPPKLPKANS